MERTARSCGPRLRLPFLGHDFPKDRRHSRGVPLYEYELCEGNCAACGGAFTLRRPLSAPELKACPACKRPVRKVITSFSTPSITKPLSITDAKKAGFTVLKRVNKGEYERQ